MADIQQTRPFDDLIASHLFRSRTVLVTGEVNSTMAQRVIAQLFALADASEDPILVVISSPGGHVESGDMMLAGAPRAVAILNGTVSAALGLGLRLWIAGLVFWAIGHMAAVWAARRDPFFVEVVRRHVRYPAHLGS